MASSHNDGRDEFHFSQGSCSIILKQGDLLDENNADVIVIPTPDESELNPDNFVLYKSIHSRVDDNFKREIKRIRSELKAQNPQIISKNGRGYIFAIPPYVGNPNKAHDYLKKTYSSCLNLAVKNNFRKIAFPTIGCGVIGFETVNAARSVYQVLENFLSSKDGKKMDEIRIIVYNSSVWKDFTAVFMEQSEPKNAKIKFIDILSRDSNPSNMPSTKDTKQISRQQSQHTESDQYEEDWEDGTAKNQRGDVKRHTSGLNPESPEYQPKSKNRHRVPRHYRLSNNRTELIILQGDILTTKVDAIVNAANESMLGGGGVDGVIHKAAGKELFNACKAHKKIYPDVRLPTGRSRILLSYDMSQTTYYIINTAGPRYDDAPPDKCKADLISCYKTSLALANLYDLETIGFTAISCGIFGYPIDEGAEVALQVVDHEADSLQKVYFVLKDDEIYDAWVKKADELQFISLDDGKAVAASTSARSTDNKKSTVQKHSENDESKVRESPPERRVIDPSTSNNTQKAHESNDKGPREGLSSDPNDNSRDQGAVNNKEDDGASNNDEKTKSKKSEEPTNNNRQAEETSDDPAKKQQTGKQEQKPLSPVPQNDKPKSIRSGDGMGRGKAKKK